MQLSARHGIFDSRPRRAAVAKEIGRGEGLVRRLIVHVLAAGDVARQRLPPGAMKTMRYAGTIGHLAATEIPQKLQRFVRIEFRIGRFDAQEKSVEAKPVRIAGTLNTG